jgi:hypothetical protein
MKKLGEGLSTGSGRGKPAPTADRSQAIHTPWQLCFFDTKVEIVYSF